MSKSNQTNVISIFLIVLNIVFFFVPLDEHWDEVKEEYYPNYIYEYSEYLIVHLTFLLCLMLNYLNKSKIVYNVVSFVLVVIALLYWVYAVMHRTTLSWQVIGSPYLVAFLPLILYRFYLIKKLKE